MKLQQNIQAYDETVMKMAKKIFDDFESADEETQDEYLEKAGALLIGRHKDGTPLVLSDKKEGSDKNQNKFYYSKNPEDLDGNKCPLHAHIRKTNPREKDKRRRIVRRGMLYGESDENSNKGLLFLSFQKDLEYQFEDIVNRYMFGYDPSDKDDGSDPLLAHDYSYRKYSKAWDGEEKVGLRINQELVTFKGGFYFFAPSIPFFTDVLPNI